MRKLSQLLGVEQEEVMYIATTETTTMIEWAGYGVAMANAIPEVGEITKKTRRGATIQELVLKNRHPIRGCFLKTKVIFSYRNIVVTLSERLVKILMPILEVIRIKLFKV